MTARASAREDFGQRGATGSGTGRRRKDGRGSVLLRATLAILALLCVAALTSLGVWQLERRIWKLQLIEQVEQRIHAAPVPVPGPSAWGEVRAADAYTRVRAAGRLLHDQEVLVQAVTERGSGFWVLTPLQISSGMTVLVNRGFIPPDRRNPATRAAGNPAGSTVVTGLLRISEPKGGFLRANDPAAGRWHSRDVAAIAASRGLSQVAPFFIDADATPNPGGWPAGGLTVVTFHNNHLVYALTWFALALMLGGATAYVVLGHWRSRRECLDANDMRDARGGEMARPAGFRVSMD